MIQGVAAEGAEVLVVLLQLAELQGERGTREIQLLGLDPALRKRRRYDLQQPLGRARTAARIFTHVDDQPFLRQLPDRVGDLVDQPIGIVDVERVDAQIAERAERLSPERRVLVRREQEFADLLDA